MYRTKSFYWNAFKWIVCEYQTEVTGRYKVQLLRKYLQDICEMQGHQKDNLIGDLNQATEWLKFKKEVDDFEATGEITITF